MQTSIRRAFLSIFLVFSLASTGLLAQSAGNSGAIYGVVTDASGAVLPGARVTVENVVSGYKRETQTDSSGHYQFTHLPLNPYHVVISSSGFGNSVRMSMCDRSFR
jgi:hypothetical protein